MNDLEREAGSKESEEHAVRVVLVAHSMGSVVHDP